MTNLHLSRRLFLQLAGAVPLCAAFGAEKFAMPLVIFGKVFEEAKLTWEQSAATLAAMPLWKPTTVHRVGGTSARPTSRRFGSAPWPRCCVRSVSSSCWQWLASSRCGGCDDHTG